MRSRTLKTELKIVVSSIILGGILGEAAPAYAQAPVLEEIIVTGQKREQNLRDISATVNVISGQQLDDLNILTLEDLERVTAGVQFIQPNPRNNLISIRGVFYDPESGSASSVDIYQNGITQRADNLFGALYDVERVEILRGPQGALQGATSPAGAIMINTTKPDLDKTTGYVRGTAADDGTNLQGALSVPLIKETLALRVTVFSDANDQAGVVNIRTGVEQDSDTDSHRLSLRWAPTENLDMTLVHQTLEQELRGTPQVVGSRSGAGAFAGAPSIPCSFLPAAEQLLCVAFTAKDRAAFAAGDAVSNRDADITTLNLDWVLGENHRLAYSYGKTESGKLSRTENDISSNLGLQNFFFAAGLGVIGDTDYRTDQSTNTVVDADTHEIRIASQDNPTWNYMFGLYSQDQETSTDFRAFSTAARYIPLTSLNGAIPGVTFTGGHIEGINFATGGTIPVNGKTEALFTSHSFKLTEKTTLETALRYQEFTGFRSSDILFDSFHQPERISIQNASVLGLPSSVADSIAQGVLQGTLANISATNIQGIPTDAQNLETDATTGSLSLKYDFSDSLTTYIAYNRSYRNGGISVLPGETLPMSALLYDEESSEAYELGFRTIAFDGRLEVNTVAYLQDFDGYQGFVRGIEYINIQGQLDPLVGGLVFNGDASIKGVEMDWRMQATDVWRVGGTFSYNKAEFDNAAIPCNIRAPGQILGLCQSSGRLPGSTELQATLFSELMMPISGSSNIFIRGNMKYSNGILSTRPVSFGEDAGETESYILADFFIGWVNESFEISAFVKNLLDEDSDIDLRNAGDPNFDINGDFTEVLLLPERSAGITVNFQF